MVLTQKLVHRRFPHWRSGLHNDAAGIMVSAAVVVYSVSIGLCIISLWDEYEEARQATEAEAVNLARWPPAPPSSPTPEHQRIRNSVLAYNRDVVQHWPRALPATPPLRAARELEALVATVGQIKAETDAQRAFVDDATARLARAFELRTISLSQIHDQQLPSVLWIAVLAGSTIVVGLCMTCGVQDEALRRILFAGVVAIVGMNLFLVGGAQLPVLRRLRAQTGGLPGRDQAAGAGGLRACSAAWGAKPEIAY